MAIKSKIEQLSISIQPAYYVPNHISTSRKYVHFEQNIHYKLQENNILACVKGSLISTNPLPNCY